MKKFILLMIAELCICSCSEKGNGSAFYLEPLDGFELVIIHSNMNCSKISKGTFKVDGDDAGLQHTYCSYCMNEDLVSRFKKTFNQKY